MKTRCAVRQFRGVAAPADASDFSPSRDRTPKDAVTAPAVDSYKKHLHQVADSCESGTSIGSIRSPNAGLPGGTGQPSEDA
jgi:hypothetical protein